MDLVAILLATLLAGVGSVWVAALLLRVGVNGRGGIGPQHLLSLAAGALLATAFMHLLPEAFEGGVSPQVLFAALLAGLVFFFLLDKAELWHHGHEHHTPGTPPGALADAVATTASRAAVPADGHAHGDPHARDRAHDQVHDQAHDDGHRHDHHASHAHDAHHLHADSHDHQHGHHHHGSRAAGGWAILTGDSVHCFGDGILIASAFAADMQLGMVAALAVLAHEVPHHIGDLVVLRQVGGGRRMALVKVSLAGSVTALGGLVGHFLLGQLHGLLPFFLIAAASSFVYVALADLIPQLQKRLSARQTAAQVAWLFAGIVLVTGVSRLAHGDHAHGHEHGHDHGHDAVHAAEDSPAGPRDNKGHRHDDGHDHGAAPEPSATAASGVSAAVGATPDAASPAPVAPSVQVAPVHPAQR